MATKMFQTISSTLIVISSLTGLVAPEILFSSPLLSPFKEEQIYKSSTKFQLTCEATKPIDWKYPATEQQSSSDEVKDEETRVEITYEQIRPEKDDYVYRSVLTVSKANILDTGYYVCHHRGNEDINNPRSAVKTYIYIEDQHHLIVSPGDEGIVTVVAHQSKQEVIPCKPTSPDVELTLLDPNGNEINPQNDPDVWSYNPHEGFIAKEMAMEMAGNYECTANRRADGASQTIIYYIMVLAATPVAPKPHIDAVAKEISLGESFHLNCSAAYDPGVTVDLRWTVPHYRGIDGVRIRTGKPTVSKATISGMEQQIVYQVVYVNNATSQDEGDYECQITDHTHKSESATVSIKIHAEGVAYVNISNVGLQSFLDQPANQTIKRVVNYEAFEWFFEIICWF